ncbi:paraquat-inducible protein A [Pseudoalteromonas sp. G4]|uniref:paraquat-inducible protein A n=1 Tax=Pseudoalteromonas sp. G4 TaxID=2992761 RepID=UPI00237D8217|nr:paraquat-inducible protein A [Pseudoalteromonas sp. G4]MDE3271462.1 paraquat-inducible protein A [Pseudoalteromonas sp. G4]
MEIQLACHHCDQLVSIPELNHGEHAYCPNCHTLLSRTIEYRNQKVVALSISSLILLFSALLYPFISFSNQGLSQTISLLDAAKILFYQDNFFVAALIDATIIGLPFVLLSLFIPLHAGLLKVLPKQVSRICLKTIFYLKPWVMSEIFLIGVLISMIKIMAMAEISFGLSFWAFSGFVVCYSLTLYYFDSNSLWQQIADQDKVIVNSGEVQRAKEQNLSACHVCQLLTNEPICPRCNTKTSVRNPRHIQWVLAFSITSLVCYLPANFFPIMHTWVFSIDEPSTILQGVFTLWNIGSYPIAIIIFIASICIPIGKLLTLFWLCYLVSSKQHISQQQASKAYVLIELIGKWSMIDVFVVVILVSLVQLGVLMSITIGIGAIFFAIMVITSMIAAQLFDPRLIWDKKRPSE